jgi:hypothetical protein
MPASNVAGVSPVACRNPHASTVLRRYKHERSGFMIAWGVSDASLLLLSVEYDRCWLSTASHGRDACHLQSIIGHGKFVLA